jgi:hypothetical protein
MYQKDGDYQEKLSVAKIAANVCEWSITRYGYFINSSVDRLDMTKAFAEELNRLPRACLNYIDKAKNQWIDSGNKRPPTMPDFLTMLREINNHNLNENKAPKIEHKESATSLTAHRWDSSKTDEQKRTFFKSYRRSETSPATRWVIREWLRNRQIDENKIISMLR